MNPPPNGPAPAPDLREIAHDIGNHLSPIMQAAAIIRLVPDLDPKVIQAVEMIERQTAALNKLLNRLRPRTA